MRGLRSALSLGGFLALVAGTPSRAFAQTPIVPTFGPGRVGIGGTS